MTISQYRRILEALDGLMPMFEQSEASLTEVDLELQRELQTLRARFLALYSGHPFAEVAEDPSGQPRIRVLIVDDNESVRMVVGTILRAEPDMEVVGEAKNGIEAVELATKHLPDVVMMDINMPEMDGIAAARETRRRHPQIKIIMFSANRTSELVRAAEESGASGFIAKPSGRAEITETVRRVYFGSFEPKSFVAVSPDEHLADR